MPCGQQWWLEKCCMNALWRKEVTPRMLHSCTVEMSDGFQDAICTHYGEEWYQPGCYVYALWTGVIVAIMLYAHTLWTGVVVTKMLYTHSV